MLSVQLTVIPVLKALTALEGAAHPCPLGAWADQAAETKCPACSHPVSRQANRRGHGPAFSCQPLSLCRALWLCRPLAGGAGTRSTGFFRVQCLLSPDFCFSGLQSSSVYFRGMLWSRSWQERKNYLDFFYQVNGWFWFFFSHLLFKFGIIYYSEARGLEPCNLEQITSVLQFPSYKWEP